MADGATDCYLRSIALWRELGYRCYVAETLTRLGENHRYTGDHEAAHSAWREALTILDELNHPMTDQVRTSITTCRS